MNDIKRRDAIKSFGVISLGTLSASIPEEFYNGNQSQIEAGEIFTDILVIGGGTAGVVAALQAARAGCKTTIIENGSQLGGTITTGGVAFPGLFHAWGKQIIGGIGWELIRETVSLNGDKLPDFSYSPARHWHNQIPINGALYALLAEEKCAEAGVEIRYYETPMEIKFEHPSWIVKTMGKGIDKKIVCNQIIDCSGNAYASSLAGFKVLRETETQPGSLLFRLDGYDFEKLDLEKIPNQYHSILRQNMLIKQRSENPEMDLPYFTPYSLVVVGSADSSTSESHTIANLKGRTALLQLVRTLKTFPGCEKLKVVEMKTETAVRETYRIDGLYQITQTDYLNGIKFEDSLSYAFYPVDLWRDGKSIHQEYLKEGIVATVPLRALIPKGSENFMVAGRCLSSDRMANSGLRVQASCMAMGQAAGAVATLANLKNTTPLKVPIKEIKNLIEEHGGIVPL